MDGSRAEMKVRALTHDDSSIGEGWGFPGGRKVKRLGRRQPKSTTRRKPRRVGSLTWNGVGLLASPESDCTCTASASTVTFSWTEPTCITKSMRVRSSTFSTTFFFSGRLEAAGLGKHRKERTSPH